MKLWSTYLLLLASATAGCSSGPTHLSADEFQRLYLKGPENSVQGYSLLGVTNGAAYMLRQRASFLHPHRENRKTFFTETNALRPGFLERMRKAPAVEQQHAADASQPFASVTIRESVAAGSHR